MMNIANLVQNKPPKNTRNQKQANCPKKGWVLKVNFKVDQYTMSGIKLNRVDMNLNNTSAKLFKTIKYCCESESVDFRC